jgi:hypothetical protein
MAFSPVQNIKGVHGGLLEALGFELEDFITNGIIGIFY